MATRGRCDLGYAVARRMGLLMRLFADELAEYNMQEVVTKCLNTAVLMMFVFLGRRALEHTRFCEVHAVQGRYASAGDQTLSTLRAFGEELLAPRRPAQPAVRTLYYVMLTDAMLPPARGRGRGRATVERERMFPGHVFVIDKDYDARGKPAFYLYQSYINHYDMAGAIARNSRTLRVGARDMAALVRGLKHMFSAGAWDRRTVDFWRELTFVDSSEFLGRAVAGHIFFCYSAAPLDTCSRHLEGMLEQRLASAALGARDRAEAAALLAELRGAAAVQ